MGKVTRLEAPTIDGMIARLWEQTEAIRSGEASAAQVNAICNAQGKILSAVKAQMEYCRLTGQTPVIPLLMATPKD